MKKTCFLAFLLSAPLCAQLKPVVQAPQPNAPAQSAPGTETAVAVQAVPTTGPVVPWTFQGKSVRDLILNGVGAPVMIAPSCAISLLQIPVDSKQTPIQIIPANPGIDPKVVVAPSLPSCGAVTSGPVKVQELPVKLPGVNPTDRK